MNKRMTRRELCKDVGGGGDDDVGCWGGGGRTAGSSAGAGISARRTRFPPFTRSRGPTRGVSS